jgi:uncharacterized protein
MQALNNHNEKDMHQPHIDWQTQLIAIATSANQNDGAHDVNHLHRVWKTAQALLRQHPEADASVVQAACYLHDLINLPKNHPDRAQASRLAAQLAREKLTEIDFPKQKLEGVMHAIEAHSFSANIATTTIEAQIVQDADRLDALGALGLARLFYTAGRMESALAHSTDPLAQHRALDDQRYALDHIEAKLATLPATMQTAEGRAIADQRLQWLREFRERFAEEWR